MVRLHQYCLSSNIANRVATNRCDPQKFRTFTPTPIIRLSYEHFGKSPEYASSDGCGPDLTEFLYQVE